jgi:transcriptional regulator with XRE-family HTH domain
VIILTQTGGDIMDKKEQIDILQKHLSSIRKIAGWSLEELGEKIGVTKQTISNLENNRTKMSLTQYIAIRSILDYEIKNNEDNEVLSKVIQILLDKNEEFSEEQKEKISESVEAIAATAASGIKGPSLKTVSKSLIDEILPYAAIGGVAALYWLAKFLNNSGEESK